MRIRAQTQPLSAHIQGNALFDRAAYAIGLDGQPTRHLLADVLSSIGVSPLELTPDDLGGTLPLIEARLRLLVPDDMAGHSIARLRQLLLRWEE